MRAWMVVGLVVAFSFCLVAGCGPKKTEELPAVDVTDVKTEPPTTPGAPLPPDRVTTERSVTKPATEKPVKPVTEKPAADAGMKTYTVEKGDTLFKIAHKFYGDGKLWPKIFDANKDKIKSSDKVPVGTVLKIPPK
jgi:nucleoid-associated protein YgaU